MPHLHAIYCTVWQFKPTVKNHGDWTPPIFVVVGGSEGQDRNPLLLGLVTFVCVCYPIVPPQYPTISHKKWWPVGSKPAFLSGKSTAYRLLESPNLGRLTWDEILWGTFRGHWDLKQQISIIWPGKNMGLWGEKIATTSLWSILGGFSSYQLTILW